MGRKKKEKSEKKPRVAKKRRSQNKPKSEKKNKAERRPRKVKPTRIKKQIIRDDTEDEAEDFGEEFDSLEEGEIRLGTVLNEREKEMDQELLEEKLVDDEKEMKDMLEEELHEKDMLEEEEDDDEFLAMKEAELALQKAELSKAKEKRRQKREAKKLEKKEQKKRGRKSKKVYEVESVQPVLISTLADKEHPVQKNVEIEPELPKTAEQPSPIPPIVLPVVSTSSPAPVVPTPTPKRRGRGRGKATLAAAVAASVSGETTTTAAALAAKLPANGQMGSTPLSGIASACFPGPNQQQPQQLSFCTQPQHSSSSVITRMLQSQPVSSGPQSFTAAATAMGHKYFGSPGNDQLPLVGPSSGNSGSGLGMGTGPSGRSTVNTAQSYSIPARGRIPSPYRQPPPLTSSPSGSPGICLPHYASPRGSHIRPPPGSIQQTTMSPLRMRTSGPGSQGPQLYHTPHHPLDPSPSGGGPIAIAPNSGVRPGGEGSPLHQPPTQIPPAAGSPLAGKPGPSPTSHNTPPPPPYTRVVPPMHQQVPPPLIRFPLQSADGNPQVQVRHPQSQFPPSTTAGNHLQQAQHSPPPHQGRNPTPGNFSPYHPPPPPNYHYGAYPPPPPLTAADDALPPSAYQGSPYPDHYASPDASHSLQASDGSNSKSYDEEGGGEFGGLVSYFSSQREDDLDA